VDANLRSTHRFIHSFRKRKKIKYRSSHRTATGRKEPTKRNQSWNTTPLTTISHIKTCLNSDLPIFVLTNTMEFNETPHVAGIVYTRFVCVGGLSDVYLSNNWVFYQAKQTNYGVHL
jgi:hypothetical protein